MQYCSLQHRTLLPSPVTSTTGCCFCFGSVSLFFLELFLHSSPVAYYPLQYSCLGYPMDREVWQVTVHGVTKSWTQWSDFTSLHRPGEFIFQCPIFLPFYTVHGVPKARILKGFAIPSSRGPCFVLDSCRLCCVSHQASWVQSWRNNHRCFCEPTSPSMKQTWSPLHLSPGLHNGCGMQDL